MTNNRVFHEVGHCPAGSQFWLPVAAEYYKNLIK